MGSFYKVNDKSKWQFLDKTIWPSPSYTIYLFIISKDSIKYGITEKY